MVYYISICYRSTGRSEIWRLDLETAGMSCIRSDDFYQPGERSQDYAYWGLECREDRIFSAGGEYLSILDRGGNVLRQARFDFLDQAHDLLVTDNRIGVLNTGQDRLDYFSRDLEYLESIDLKALPCFGNRRLTTKREGLNDSLHFNRIWESAGQIYLTHSFTCEHRPWKHRQLRARRILHRPVARHAGLKHRGIALADRPKVVNGGAVRKLDGTPVLENVYGAHDGCFEEQTLFVNETYNVQTVIFDPDSGDRRFIRYPFISIIRGLYVEPDFLLVGSTRIGSDRTGVPQMYSNLFPRKSGIEHEKMSSIKQVDRTSCAIMASFEFEPHRGVHPEIFMISRFENESGTPQI